MKVCNSLTNGLKFHGNAIEFIEISKETSTFVEDILKGFFVKTMPPQRSKLFAWKLKTKPEAFLACFTFGISVALD